MELISVPTVQIHCAGAQASSALQSPAHRALLKRIFIGLVQVIKGGSPFHVCAAWFWRSISLEFLDKELTAAPENIPQLPEGTTALQGS